MCSQDAACGPCAGRAVRETPLVAVEQAEREVVVWGPASVEIEARNGLVITTAAVEQALPQLLRRRTVDLFHKSAFGVGEVIPEVRPDPTRTPANPALQRVLAEAGGSLRSDVYTVTQAIATLFPRLRPVVGTRQVFLASRIYGDNDTSRQAQQSALAGKLDSYSVAGVAREVEQTEVCAPGGCREVQRVLRIDLNAVTLCGQSPRPEVGVPQAQNPLAGFVVVQMAAAEPLYTSETHAMTNQSPSPTTTPSTAAVEQSEPNPPSDAAPAAAATGQRLEEALVRQGERIEQLEQVVAELRGSRNSLQEKAEEDAGKDGKNPTNEETTEEKDMPNDQNPNKKPDEKPVEQAQPPASDAAPPAWFQGFTNNLPTLIEQAAAKAVDARLNALGIGIEQAKPAAPNARVSLVATPQPATAQPASSVASGEDSLARLVEAAECGDPAAFSNAMRTHAPMILRRNQ